MASAVLPTLFIGHGSPMNALDQGHYHTTLLNLAQSLPRPRAILCISAHWLSRGTFITAADQVPIIHDFHGFPAELHRFQYAAPGSKKIAHEIATAFPDLKIQLDDTERGLDHGAWSVLTHLYPSADIPVLQLSLDVNKTPAEHLKAGERLTELREQGILIVASGNIVHNLRTISWSPQAVALPWAHEFDLWVKRQLVEKNFTGLANDFLNTEAGRLSVPTTEHYLPLLYTAGSSKPHDKITFFMEEIQNSSISMRSCVFSV